MTRVGPNQDINDPTDLKTLRALGETVSISVKQKSEWFNGQPFTGTPYIPITVDLKLENGQSELVTNNESVFWTQAVINTYINQAERFREFWNNINNFASDDLIAEDIITTFSFDIGTPDCEKTYLTVEISNEPQSSVSGLRRSNIKVCTFPLLFGINGLSSSGLDYISLNEPIWSGNGPVDYNYNTLPQLQYEFDRLNDQIFHTRPSNASLLLSPATFGYMESTVYSEWDVPAPLRRSSLSVSQKLDTGIDTPYFFIYNQTFVDISLNINFSLTVTPNGIPSILHSASKRIIVGSNQTYLSTSQGDTYEEVDNLGGVFSDSTIITIPAKTTIGISFPLLYESSASSNWTTEGDRIPENSLGAFLSILNLNITMQGVSDSVEFEPVVTI